MKPFPTAICYHETVQKSLICIRWLVFVFFCLCFRPWFLFFSLMLPYRLFISALGSSCTMTKRDSLIAGFTYPSSSMSMPRRHSWRSRSHGHPSSTAAPSAPVMPSNSATDPTASDVGPSLLPAGSTDHPSHLGYTRLQTRPHPSQLLPITRLQSFQDSKQKPFPSRWNWQKLVVNFMHITSSRFKHLTMT